MLDELYGPFVTQVIEKAHNVRIEYPVHLLSLNTHRQSVKRLMRAAARSKPVREALEVDLVNLIEDRHHRLLEYFVLHSRHGQRRLHLTAVRLWDGWRYVIRSIHFEASASKYSNSGV